MSGSAALFTIVSNNSGVTAFFGTNPCRFFPAGYIPQDQPMPAASFQTIGGAPANTLDAAAPADNDRIQVDCWSDDYDEAIDVAEAIRTAIESASAQTALAVGMQIVSFNGHDYDSETKRFRVSFDVSIWSSR